MTSKKGFTLVELSIAVGFISVLLLTIALFLNTIPNIYQKGVTANAINYSGQELIDEFTSAITASSNNNLDILCEDNAHCKNGDDGGMKYLAQTFYSPKPIRIKRPDNPVGYVDAKVPIGGVMCTGYYSFIWNSGYVLDEEGKSYVKQDDKPIGESDFDTYRVRYKDTNGVVHSDFRLVRVLDTQRYICSQRIEGDGKNYNSAEDFSLNHEPISLPVITFDTDRNLFLELLQQGDANLALYDLQMFRPTRSSTNNHAFYSGSFIIATIEGSVDITSTGNFCTPPEGAGINSDFIYCAINKFNFAVRATGGIKL